MLLTASRQLAVTTKASKTPNQPCCLLPAQRRSHLHVPRPRRAAPGGAAALRGAETPTEAELQLRLPAVPPSPLSPLSLLSPQPPRSPAQGRREEAAALGQAIDGLSGDKGPHLVASPWRGASWSIFMAAILQTPAAVTSRHTQSRQPSEADRSLLPMRQPGESGQETVTRVGAGDLSRVPCLWVRRATSPHHQITHRRGAGGPQAAGTQM